VYYYGEIHGIKEQ